MDDQRTEYARSVAERIEQEFLEKLRRFMAASVPLEDIARVQEQFGARKATVAQPALRLLAADPAPVSDIRPTSDVRVRSAA
jgi:hypothetical protein